MYLIGDPYAHAYIKQPLYQLELTFFDSFEENLRAVILIKCKMKCKQKTRSKAKIRINSAI